MLETILGFFQNIIFLAGYIQNGSSFPEPLNAEEEKDNIEKLVQGDENARNILIEHNMRLVAHIAKKYTTSKRDADDLISIGAVGLIKAVSTFKPGMGNTLATYASKCIENEILMSLRTEKKQAGEVSLNEPIGIDKDGNEISLADILGCDPDQTHNEAEKSISQQQLLHIIENYLNPREQTVIKLRYGIPSGFSMPQREVAAILGISRSYVSRLEKKALHKLRSSFLGEKADKLR